MASMEQTSFTMQLQNYLHHVSTCFCDARAVCLRIYGIAQLLSENTYNFIYGQHIAGLTFAAVNQQYQ